MLVGIQEEILRLNSLQLLGKLLQDKTTKGNIIWATDAYQEYGPEYAKDREIKVHLIIGRNSNIIKNRVRRELEQQTNRTKRHAEVSTPLWVCNQMNDFIDNNWYSDNFSLINFDIRIKGILKSEGIKKYINSRRLEITCGEAPFLVQRYDSCTGESLPLEERSGILDRKLRLVKELAKDDSQWIYWCSRAFQSVYGYEYQGDSLLVARLNLLMSFEDYLWDAYHRKPTKKEYELIINIITWNLMQMDGLTYQVPWNKVREYQLDLFADANELVAEPDTVHTWVKTYNWRRDNSIEMRIVNEGGPRDMKFDFIVGNPPFQDEVNGELRNYAPPIYHLFMEEAFKLSSRVELIHPARFLFRAGDTPKVWNEKMLSDDHYKVLYYNENGHEVFPSLSVPLRGGVAISYRDENQFFGAILSFTPHLPMIGIVHKVKNNFQYPFKSLYDITYSRTTCRLTDEMHADFPLAIKKLSKGHAYDMSSNIFSRIPEVFKDSKEEINEPAVSIFGRLNGVRLYKYCPRRYINNVPNLEFFKVFVPQASGNGLFGEILGEPVVEGPDVASTETFISIGKFKTKVEADNLLKYIKTKFTRALLGVLKVTQNGNKGVWKMIPIQDFTLQSDIDWSKSVADIDKQLYAKYNLSPEEIEFIETHVKEMN